jgi:hypothetical protein
MFILAARTAFASAVFGAIGIAFLTAMFASFAVGATPSALAFGRINDLLVLVSYALAAPSVYALHTLLRRRSPVLSAVIALVGIIAIVAIVILQALLVMEVLTFDEQSGPVTVAFVVLGGWFIATGRMATSDGYWSHGVRLGALAAVYFGYPVWAYNVARRFLERADPEPDGLSRRAGVL